MAEHGTKTSAGNFFEDFRLDQEIVHATPRTITTGDVALYTGLFGSRFAVTSADAFAERLGLPRSPIDDVLVFHVVFGKTVPDISLNAVANLGYAGRSLRRSRLPGRHLVRHLAGDRPEREFERQDRGRLRPHDGPQSGCGLRPRLRALGHGQQT